MNPIFSWRDPLARAAHPFGCIDIIFIMDSPLLHIYDVRCTMYAVQMYVVRCRWSWFKCPPIIKYATKPVKRHYLAKL